MSVGLFGVGFVGQALKTVFEERNEIVFAFDPAKTKYATSEIELSAANQKIVFICVPTPMSLDGSVDISIISKVCKRIQILNPDAILVVKSTVPPTFSNSFDRMVANPEFLTARTSTKDFRNQKHIVIGGKPELTQEILNLYKRMGFDCLYSSMTFQEAMLMKQACNSFYAMKIAFFNELKMLADKLDCSFERVRDAMLSNGWINPMHTLVPGPDGQLGFGGACLPKDSAGLLKFAAGCEVDFQTIAGAIKTNKLLRPEYYSDEI